MDTAQQHRSGRAHNSNSTEAWIKHTHSDAPANQESLILSTMNKGNKPMSYYEISVGGMEHFKKDIPVTNMGQLIGRNLIKQGLVFRLKGMKGRNRKGNKVDLFITKKFLKDNPSYTEYLSDKKVTPEKNIPGDLKGTQGKLFESSFSTNNMI